MAAFAIARLPFDAVPDIRRKPEAALGIDVPSSACKHLDEQSVAGLAAVGRAVQALGATGPTDFRDWGVLAAPQFLGQGQMVQTLLRFQKEGAWGISPHVIPHHSLHSLSGTISLALKMHGPNLGVGGGPGGTGESLLAAAAWLGRRRVPGIWVVLTTLDPLTAYAENGAPAPGTECVALAVALVAARAETGTLRLRLVPDVRRADTSLDLFRLHSCLELARSARGSGSLVVASGAPQVEIEWHRPAWPQGPHGHLFRAAEAPARVVPVRSVRETES